MTIHDAYRILKKKFPNANPTFGFEYKNLFIFNTGSNVIGLPYAVHRDTRKVSLFNPLHEKPDILKSAFLKTKVDF